MWLKVGTSYYAIDKITCFTVLGDTCYITMVNDGQDYSKHTGDLAKEAISAWNEYLGSHEQRTVWEASK